MPAWIKVDSLAKTAIVNLSQEEKFHFAMPMFVDMYLIKYPYITLQKPFNVTLSSASFTCLNNPKLLFITGEPDSQFGIVYNNATHLEGSWKLTQVIEPWIQNENL